MNIKFLITIAEHYNASETLEQISDTMPELDHYPSSKQDQTTVIFNHLGLFSPSTPLNNND